MRPRSEVWMGVAVCAGAPRAAAPSQPWVTAGQEAARCARHRHTSLAAAPHSSAPYHLATLPARAPSHGVVCALGSASVWTPRRGLEPNDRAYRHVSQHEGERVNRQRVCVVRVGVCLPHAGEAPPACELVVDQRAAGNVARLIRPSAQPNLRHQVGAHTRLPRRRRSNEALMAGNGRVARAAASLSRRRRLAVGFRQLVLQAVR